MMDDKLIRTKVTSVVEWVSREHTEAKRKARTEHDILTSAIYIARSKAFDDALQEIMRVFAKELLPEPKVSE